MKSYDYASRKGIEEISWERFAQLAAGLSEQLAAEDPGLIVGIARAGLFPATFAACALRRELFPVRVSRRVNDRVAFDHPVWRVDVPAQVRDATVAVVDEMADSGETLEVVAARARELGARRVITASLVSHSWAKPRPALTALVSDAFVIFPWDRRVFQDGAWRPHPETEEGLKLQGRTPY